MAAGQWDLCLGSPLLTRPPSHTCTVCTLPFPQSHMGCGCRSSHCLYTQVSVCSSLNQPLVKEKKKEAEPIGKHTVHIKIHGYLTQSLNTYVSSKCCICMQMALHVCVVTCKSGTAVRSRANYMTVPCGHQKCKHAYLHIYLDHTDGKQWHPCWRRYQQGRGYSGQIPVLHCGCRVYNGNTLTCRPPLKETHQSPCNH